MSPRPRSDEDLPDAPPPSRRRRIARLLVLSLVATVVWAGIWTLVVLLTEKSDLQDARATIVAARESGNAADASAALASAEKDLHQANSRLSAPGPRLIGLLPYVGRPVDAARRTAEAGESVITATRSVLDVAGDGNGLLVDGRLDLARVQRIDQALAEAAATTAGPVARLQAQSTAMLPGIVGDPVSQAKDLLGPLPATFARAAQGLDAVSGVLGDTRTRHLVIALENNAELRGTGGLVTVFAEATARDGKITITGFRDVKDVADVPPDVTRVPSPPSYHELWGTFRADTTLWKNANMSPDIPESSAVLAEIGRRTLPQAPDAVLWFDVPAIADILRATGPATLPDGSVLDADNAVDVLLSQAYRGAVDTRTGQAQRREALSGAADVVLERLLSGGADPAGLALALSDASRGRHLALWSADAEEQSQLVTAGLAGEVSSPGDLSSFTINNLGGGDRDGNKLDFYARRDVSVDVVLEQDSAIVTQKVVLRNTAPAKGLPRYVAGAADGTTSNFVTMALPYDARDVSFTRTNAQVSNVPRPESSHQVVTDAVRLAPGTSASWQLRYRVPIKDGDYTLEVFPQPLAFDATLHVRVRADQGFQLAAPVGYDGPFATTMTFQAKAEVPGVPRRVLNRVKGFWNDPVVQ